MRAPNLQFQQLKLSVSTSQARRVRAPQPAGRADAAEASSFVATFPGCVVAAGGHVVLFQLR